MLGIRRAWLSLAVLTAAISAIPAARAEEPESPARARVKTAEQIYARLLDETVELLYAPPEPPDPSRGVMDLLNAEKAEEFYRWSRRWMEAERDNASSKEQRIAAVQAHLKRMRDQEAGLILKRRLSLMRHRDGTPLSPEEQKEEENKMDAIATDELWTNTAFARSIRYFRLEAEVWLAEAKR